MKIREDFKSDEEFYFYLWLKEAEDNGLICGVAYEPTSYELCPRAAVTYDKQIKTKVKNVEKFLFYNHEYTPDFIFIINDQRLTEYFVAPKYLGKLAVTVDVKGTFHKHNDGRAFSMNQKWMWVRFGIYVEKIVPKKMFKDIWVPDALRFTPSQKKPAAIARGCKTIDEFMGR